ncbi:MAG: RND transporter [Gammaproteobacteria bacterium]|nr:RND transporter [Gammaproteobacteria bacterium]
MTLIRFCSVLKLERIPYGLLVIASLTLGLAPFVPEPHVWEKIKMLVGGELARPIDIFDLVMHATPMILLLIKLGCQTNKSKN